VNLSPVQHLDPGHPVSVKDQPPHHSMGQHGQVGAVHIGIGVGPKHRFPGAVIADPQIDDRGARLGFHHAAIRVFERRYPHRPRSFQGRGRQRVGIGRGLDEHRAAAAPVVRVRRTVPVFDAPVDGKHIVVLPGRIPGLGREVVPVAAMPTRPDHRVDARAPAQHLAHGQGKHTPAQGRVRFALKAPVAFTTEVGRPKIGRPHTGNIVAAARFQ
jgi:hypothetical protein